MKKIFIRFYDKNNLGDDLFVKIITERYKNPFITYLSLDNAKLESIDNLTVYKNRIAFLFSKLLERIVGSRNLLFRVLISKVDILLYVGGSIFIEGDSLARWRQESSFYKSIHKPYYVLGSNFGPARTQEFKEIVEDIAENASDICFRDVASYNQFKHITSARHATDIAFTLNVKPYIKQTEKTVVFSVINADEKFSSTLASAYRKTIVSLTEKFIGQGYKVVYMSFCRYEGDMRGVEEVVSMLNSVARKKVTVYDYDGNLEEALNVLGSSEIIVGGRFHATILGLLFGKKVLPMAYSDKTINILNDMNFKGPVVDIREIENFDVSKFKLSQFHKNDVSKQIKLAEKQFQELDKVLVRRK